MTNKKKQNRVIYICLIALLVTASVLIAIASASNKAKVEPNDGAFHEGDRVKQTSEKEEIPTETEKDNKPAKDTETQKTSAEKEPTQAVSLTIDDISFVPPADGSISMGYSVSVPVYSLTMNDYRTHNGVDIVTEASAKVRACADGEVVSMGRDPMMGMSVRIAHEGGVESVYRNLSDELSEGIKVGSKVLAGDVIASVGDTALAECEEEPHLHFELVSAGKSVDPSEFIFIPKLDESYEG